MFEHHGPGGAVTATGGDQTVGCVSGSRGGGTLGDGRRSDAAEGGVSGCSEMAGDPLEGWWKCLSGSKVQRTPVQGDGTL